MRHLTEAEVTKEVEDIKTRAWPFGDVLHVKNLYWKDTTPIQPWTGVIRRGQQGVPVPTVFSTPHIDDEDPVYPFATLEEMVRAGWVVD